MATEQLKFSFNKARFEDLFNERKKFFPQFIPYDTHELFERDAFFVNLVMFQKNKHGRTIADLILEWSEEPVPEMLWKFERQFKLFKEEGWDAVPLTYPEGDGFSLRKSDNDSGAPL